MGHVGREEDWNDFYALMGRYVVAAGNVESSMFILLLDLERIAKKSPSEEAPSWSQLIERLEKISVRTPYEERVHTLLVGARRRGRLRNTFVHASWELAGDGIYAGRRHYSKRGEGSADISLSRETLVNDLQVMERFLADLETIGQEAQHYWLSTL